MYDNATLKRKTVKELAIEMITLLKKRRRFIRLLLQQSHEGGALHQEWIHRPDALHRISDL
jgi:hypothetical protein